MIAEGRHVGLAARPGVTVGERRPHVRREEAQDVVKRDFVVVHLVEALRSGELIHGLCGRIRPEILMSPRVGANLMASSVHALDNRRIASINISNLSLAVVVSSYEEGRRDIVLRQDVQNVRRVDEWAIIEGQGNDAGLDAVVNPNAAIRDTTKLRTSHVGRLRSRRDLQRVRT